MPPKKAPAKKAAPVQKQSSELDLVRSLALILEETGLSEIEIDQRGTRVRVSRGGIAMHAPVMHAMPAPAAAPAVTEAKTARTPDAEHAGTVKSPMVGTAYLAPTPGAAQFVEIGQEVKAGQTLLIIEAMKTMNQIHAPSAGRVIKFFIDNGDPVEFGAPLVVIE